MEKESLDFLVIAPTPFYANRGCHMRIRGEAEALQKKGKRLIIVTYNEGEDVGGLKIIRAPLGFGFGQGVAASWKNIPAGILLFWTVLYETVYRRPKYLYGHLFEGAAIGMAVKYLAFVLSLLKYKPLLVLDAQDSLSAKMVSYKMIKRGSWLFKLFSWIEKFILYFPDFVFASSVQSAHQLKKIRPQANPINLADGISIFLPDVSASFVNKFRKSSGKIDALSKIPEFFSQKQFDLIKKWLSENKVIALYTGSYSTGKGFPMFVEKCLSQLLNNDNLRFLFGGNNSPEISELESLMRKYPNRIISTGTLNPRELLYFSLLGSLGVDCKPPGTSEASGKILNYMAVGLPVVCFDQRNNRFTLEDGGLMAKDYSEFTKNIIKLANDPDLASEMGEKNFRRVWSEFTWDKTAEKIINCLLPGKRL